MQVSDNPFDSQSNLTEQQSRDVRLLTDYLRDARGLIDRPERRLVVTKAGATVAIVPVVNLGEKASHFHREEGAISITSDGGVAGCVVNLDERTSITEAQFFHVVNNEVVAGPRLVASELAPADEPAEALFDPGELSIYALRVLSTDVESRMAHPELDYAELFSHRNQEFLSTVARDMFTLMKGGGIGPVAVSTSSSTSCTGCSSCSTSCAVAADADHRFRGQSSYLAGLGEDHRFVALLLTNQLGAVVE